MKAILLIALLVTAAVASQSEFDSFLTKYGKKYSGLEYVRRLQIFEQNMKIAKIHQMEDPTAVHGVTKFSDLTQDEFAARYLVAPVPTDVLVKNCLKNGVFKNHQVDPTDPIPDAFDWRDTPYVVTAVKDQASCGSCWAFSTAADVEGVYGVHGISLANDTQKSLSPQFIVDCSTSCSSEIYYGSNVTVCNGGCNGGWPWTAFYDVAAQGGLPGWTDYPYTGVTGSCKGNANHKTLAPIADFDCVSGPDAASEVVMQQYMMKNGPLSIAVDANYFSSYSKGVLDPAGCSTQALNHAILLVGWGHDSSVNKDYWIIKNSWGASWGEQGYVRLARGKGACGVNLGVSHACLNKNCSPY